MSPKPVYFLETRPRKAPTKAFASNYSVKNIFILLEGSWFFPADLLPQILVDS